MNSTLPRVRATTILGVRRNGRVYIALEAAGPAMAPVGRVSPQTARYLDDQRFSVWPLSA